MEDYNEIIKELLFSQFSAVPIAGTEPILMGTHRILLMVCGVIPSTPIDEHDIFNIMTELGYQKTLKTIYSVDEKSNEKEKKEVSGYVFLWVLYKITG